jgi:hypothetical protein
MKIQWIVIWPMHSFFLMLPQQEYIDKSQLALDKEKNCKYLSQGGCINGGRGIFVSSDDEAD